MRQAIGKIHPGESLAPPQPLTGPLANP